MKLVLNPYKSSRYTMLIIMAIITLIIPMLLFYVGLKPGGINLNSAIASSEFTSENYAKLLFGSSAGAEVFRGSILNSIVYSAIASFFATLFALIAGVWISGYNKKTAVGLTFILLTLVLLPQTYLVLAGLKIIGHVPFLESESIRIVFFLFLSVIPLSIWFFYFMGGEKIRQMLTLVALDGANTKKMMWLIYKNIKIETLIVFLFTFAFVWGNFLIPFAFGSTDSFTATVQISSFTTHLGKDWASIAAAGFTMLIPLILIIVVIKLYNYENYRRLS
ncbi:MAG: hypothetical protein K9I74_01280 [Bacteroidales bacterium]|nr:hypothetical protein [Bacteroidales bacterium]